MIRPISIVVVACVIGGCSGQAGRGSDTATATATSRAPQGPAVVAPSSRDTNPATSPPGATPPVGDSARADTAPTRPTDAVTNPTHATLVAVRTARQADFERVVFEFDTHVPQHDVKYLPNPMQCGSGDPVTVTGSATLVARFRSTVAHRFEGERPIITVPARDLSPALPRVKQLKQICDFEGEVEWVIGLAGQRPFTVSTLTAPPRIVVDIR